MLKKFFLSASLFFTGLFILADLNGRWQGTVKTSNGNEIEITYDLKVEGEKLSGTVITQWGENPIVDGKVTGDQFSFTQSFNEMQINHSGKLSGDSLMVKIQRGDNPAMESVFKRVAK